MDAWLRYGCSALIWADISTSQLLPNVRQEAVSAGGQTMTNTDRITQMQVDKLLLQELIKSGSVDPAQCKGMIKMLDYKIRKLTQTATRRGG